MNRSSFSRAFRSPLFLWMMFAVAGQAQIRNWQTGQVIPGTEQIQIGPNIGLVGWNQPDRNLRFADFSNQELSLIDFRQSWLDDARFTGSTLDGINFAESNLTRVDLTDAKIFSASFASAVGFRPEQLYSTKNYRESKYLPLDLSGLDLRGWDFSGMRFNNAIFDRANVAGADFTNTLLSGASLRNVTSSGLTREQFYSSLSYKSKSLNGTRLDGNNLSGWDFAEQSLNSVGLSDSDLTGANLQGSSLLNVDLRRAVLAGAVLSGAHIDGVRLDDTVSRGFTKEQLYSTANYLGRNLRYIGLASNDLRGWDFSRQDLTGGDFENAQLTDANFKGAWLQGANFNGVTWSGADLTDAFIGGVSLDGATNRGFTKEQLYQTLSYRNGRLNGAQFGPAADGQSNDLSGWNFSRQLLKNADFEKARLVDADLTGTTLQGARFWNTDMRGSILRGADLSFAHVEATRLDNVDLTDATIAGAKLYSATANGLTREQFQSTKSYRERDLRGIDLSGNDLRGWDVSGRNLSASVLHGASVDEIDLRGANLSGAFIDVANGRLTAKVDAGTTYSQWTFFNETENNQAVFDPVAAGMTFKMAMPGDFDGDDQLTIFDLDLLTRRISGQTLGRSAMFELDGDGVLSYGDLKTWITSLKKTWIGDSNLDGEFNSSDFVLVFQGGEYEDNVTKNSTWITGDWNADGEFDSSDFVYAFSDGGCYCKGPRPAEAVPEPTCLPVLTVLAICQLIRRRSILDRHSADSPASQGSSNFGNGRKTPAAVQPPCTWLGSQIKSVVCSESWKCATDHLPQPALPASN